ncbi:hypothetical protein FRC08_001151 [Ceratobasidium sp. 394]|nr:hypothetical protein FRC08_001151 [Ceratobasidium sp. 394]
MSQTNSKARKQLQRVARRDKADKVNAALLGLQKKIAEMLKATANELEFNVKEFTRMFIANGTMHLEAAKPTAWNGLVHEKSREWVDMKGTYSGAKYIQYIVECIKDEGLYEKMSKEDEARYVERAQQLRDSKISVGNAGTGTQRKTPGNAQAELDAMAKQLLHLNNVTGAECILMVVRGHEEDGLNPIYISSPKAQNYLEDHLKIDSDHFVTLLECSVIGGVAAVANQHRTDTQIIKSQVRAALLDSLCKAATSTASDGSEPMITDPSLIPAVSYSDYVSFVDQYKIEAFNWPMNEEKDKLIDPSNVGGHKTLLTYLKLIRSGDAGFRRMTEATWDAWKEAHDQREVVIPTKRARPKRSHPVPNVDEEQPAEEQPASKKARKATHQTKTKPKNKAKVKAKVKVKAKDVGPASEQATKTSNSDAPVGGTAGEEDYPSENNLGPPVSPPPPSTVSVIPQPTVSNARPNWTDTTPASPPLPQELTITINRRPRTPPTPSTVFNIVTIADFPSASCSNASTLRRRLVQLFLEFSTW